jgi:hypothetical protein
VKTGGQQVLVYRLLNIQLDHPPTIFQAQQVHPTPRQAQATTAQVQITTPLQARTTIALHQAQVLIALQALATIARAVPTVPLLNTAISTTTDTKHDKRDPEPGHLILPIKIIITGLTRLNTILDQQQECDTDPRLSPMYLTTNIA